MLLGYQRHAIHIYYDGNFFVTVAMYGHEPSGKIRGGKRLIQVGFKPWMARC